MYKSLSEEGVFALRPLRGAGASQPETFCHVEEDINVIIYA